MKKGIITIILSDRKGLFARQIKIAESMDKGGYSVKVLAWDRTNKLPKIENIDKLKVVNFGFKPITGKWGIFLSYPIWWIYVTAFLLRDDSTAYHCENLYSLIPAIPLKIFKKKKIIYDLVDFAATSFVWPKYIEKSFALLENFCLSFADGIIVVDSRKQQIKSSNIKILEVIPNCPTDLVFKSQEDKRQKDFTVYYGGWISETRGLKQLCEAVRDTPDVKVIIAGYGPDENTLKEFSKSLRNIEFKGILTNKESLEWTVNSDAVFAFYDPDIPINKVAVPAKIPEAMMCSKPVLINSESSLVAEIIRKEKCGLTISYNDVEGLKKAISELKRSPKLRTILGQNGRRAFEKEYNWDKMETKLLKLYGLCIQKNI